ncbi:MAG: hypothetical protein M3Q80_02830, partial [bacterium]|nr:hypothetical protein [bacterium]
MVRHEDSVIYKQVKRGEGSSVNDMICELTSAPYRFEVANTSDPIYVWIAVVDEDWELLFFKSVTFYLETAPGGWRVPPHALNISLEMSSNIPLLVPDAQSARLLVRNDEGEIVDYIYIEMWNDDKISFPEAYAGKNGEIIIETGDYDGDEMQTLVYSLTGRRITPERVSPIFSGHIENYT